MAQTIKLKRSSTGGAVPSTSSLSLGEVAINTYDGKMYIKKNDGSDAIVEIGAGTSAVWKSYDYTATSNQTSFSGNDNNSDSLSYVAGFVQVFLNGILLDPAVDYTATTGSSIVLTSGATTGDLLQIESFTQIIGTGDILVDTFAVSSTQTAFTLSQDPINKSNISVYVEGVYQESSTYSLSTTTLTLSESPANGTTVEVVIGTRNVTLDNIADLTISGTLHAGALDLGDANIINVNEISLDTIKGDADANTNITFAGSDVTTFTQGGTERLRLNTTGAEVTGNIVVSGNVDGRDVAADGVTADAALPRAGGAMGGAITTNSTFDGRDVSVDGTKLDTIEVSATADQTDVEIRAAVESASDSNVFTNADHSKLDAIEASADVTDATNVTAAGALMDSEVTNLAQVKAFDSSDYATAAQGTTANAALPKAGGTMTGALTVGGTTQVTASEFRITSSAAYNTHLNYNNTGTNFISQANGGTTSIRNSAGTLFTFGSSGTLNVHSGNFQMGSTTIIDTNRNLTNIGTISSGPITSTGNLVLNATGHNYIEIKNSATSTKDWRIYNGQSWNPDALMIYNHTDDATVITVEPGKVGINRGASSISHTLDVGGNIAISATQIVDANRNLTNIGTISSGTITGTTATASGGTNTTALASTAFVQQELTTLIGGAPSTLNDLNELAAAINDDANYNSTLTTALATKLPLAGGTMTGALTINSGTANTGLTISSTDAASWLTMTDPTASLFFGNTGGDFALWTGGSEAMRIDSSGTVGIGVTPSTWGTSSDFRGLQIGTGGVLYGRGSGDGGKVGLLANIFRDNGADRFEYITSSYGSAYQQSDGAHYFDTAVSGTANAAVTLVRQMTIESGGNVGIGTASGEANLVVRDRVDGTHKGGRIGFGIHEAGALQMYHATNMSKTAGSIVTDSTASGGDNVTLSSGQLYGPYHTLPRGQYRMCVKMKTTNAAYTGDAARITLHTSGGTVIPESRTVRGVDFGTNNKWQTFSVPFQVVGAATNAVEFYLFALNSQVISVDYFFIMNDTDSYSTKVYGDQIVDGDVGIGTTSPLAKLHIVDGNNNAQIGDLNGSSTMVLQMADSGASPIQLEAHGTSLRIYTSTTSGATPTVKMTVLANGNVGIGTTSPSAKLDVGGDATAWSTIAAVTLTDINNRTSSRNWSMRAGGAGYGSFTIGTSAAADGNPNDGTGLNRLEIDLSGNVKIPTGNLVIGTAGKGIDFSATGNSSGNMASELLDDYEEGTWTPEIDGTSGGAYTMGGINTGRYTKIGRMVSIQFTVQWTGRTTAYSGLAVIKGLPFTSRGSRAAGTLSAPSYGVSYPSGSHLNLVVDPNQTHIYLIVNSPTGAGYSHSPTIGTTGTIYACSVVYEAD